jgi:AraC-like DNA-binding protein
LLPEAVLPWIGLSHESLQQVRQQCIERLLNLDQRLTGIDAHITHRPQRVEKRIAHRFEKRPAFQLEAIQTATGTGASQTHFHRQIENQCQIRAQIALNERLQRSNALH